MISKVNPETAHLQPTSTMIDRINWPPLMH